MAEKEKMKLVANNKKAYHDYFIDETYEAGIELHGTEVKSMRMGKCSIKESFIRIEKGEVFIYGKQIPLQGNVFMLFERRYRQRFFYVQFSTPTVIEYAVR